MDVGAHVQAGEECKNVSFLAKCSCAACSRDSRRAGRTAAIRDSWRRKLSRVHAAHRIAKAQVEQVNAELQSLAAVHARKTYLKQNLWLGGGHRDIQQVHYLAGGRSNFNGAR